VLRVEVHDEVGMKYAGRPSPETSIVVARRGSNPKDVVDGSTADRSGKFLMYIVTPSTKSHLDDLELYCHLGCNFGFQKLEIRW
jgi:hypothetical protein